MIVYYLHVVSVSISPFKTDTPPVADTDAILPCPIPSQFLQAICRWNTQIIQRYGVVPRTFSSLALP
jgi:hypothetical protein